VGAKVSADEDGVEDVVDGADDEAAPYGEECGFAPVAVKAEVDGDGSPDEEGTEGGDHGKGGEGKRPEDDSGDTQGPEGEAGENSLYERDGEPTEESGIDGVVDAFEELSRLIFAEGNDGAQSCEGELTVAKEKEEEEEHDDHLGDEVDGVSEDDCGFAAYVGSGGAGGVVDVDGGGEDFDAVGERGMIADVIGEEVLRIGIAEGDDGAESLFAELLREEETGDDDGKDDENEGDGGAESAAANVPGEPVMGNLCDDGQDDGSDDSREEGLEDEGAEDE